jgi:multidrug efflux pump subunit AcrB
MNNPGGGPRWLDRKKASLCICFGLCALSAFIIAFPGNPRRGGQGASYTVTLRHYGVDLREMERSAAIPLEDALAAIPGVRGVLSSSENGRVRAFVRFDRKKPGQYEAVREAAQGVYEGLPASAQRPEILSSDNSRIPVWSAAVINKGGAGPARPGAYTAGDTAARLERIVKPKLEGLEGAGEVEISGAGLVEILVVLKPDKAAALGLGPHDIAGVLGNNDLLLPGGRIEKEGREILLTVDGRYGDSSGLAEALIPLGNGRTARLGDVASVYEQEREPDTLSRLNGKKAAVISVMGSSGADLGKLSRRIKAALDETGVFAPGDQPLELIVLSDRGAEETAAYRSVLAAALEGSLAVALMVFLLGFGKRGGPAGRGYTGEKPSSFAAGGGLVCALAVPGVCLFSAALLALLGYPLDRPVLGGIAAGLGAAVDAAILCSEGLRFCRNTGEARAALGRLKAPLISGSVTTAVSLLPLGAVESMAGGIAALAWAIGLVNITALVFSLTLLPPLFLWGMERNRKAPPAPPRKRGPADFWPPFQALQTAGRLFARRVLRGGLRFLAADLRCCIKHPGMVLAGGLLFSAAGVLAILISGTDPDGGFSGDSVFAQVEFDGGFRAQEADRLLADYAERLLAKGGIKNIQTSARTASGSILISFDVKKTKAAQVRESARTLDIPGGFVYFPESSPEERNWEIKISGDDDGRCRELAVRAAALCAALPPVKEEVLNFKEGSGRLTLVPDRERLAESGFDFSSAAGTARWGVHGPVAYKRIGPRGETDVRVRGTDRREPSREEALGILVAAAPDEGGPGIPLRLDSLMNVREGREPASIRREDRRRTASISVRTGVMDPRRVRREVMGVLKNLELPPGYTVEFDPEAISRAEALSGTVLFFLLALLFCYMVIASVHESFGIPLAVLSVVPPSLAFPALCLALRGSPLNPAAACAFVAVSGMAVNAAVLSAGGLTPFLEFRRGGAGTGGKNPGGGFALYRGLREKVPALLATSGTTVAGAAPFLFLREGANTLVRILALVSALGVGASCLCSLCIIPALAVKYPKLFESVSKLEF